MSEEKTLTAFYRIFQGNTAFYTIHAKPFAAKGKKLVAKFCGFAKYGSKSFPEIPEGFEDGDFVPLTKEQYREHLNGGDGLAVSPLCNTHDKNNVCYFAVIDIDAYGGVDFTWLIRKLYQVGFKFAAFLSKSGALHIDFFFRDAEPGDLVIETLSKIVEVFGLKKIFADEKGNNKIEIFPKSPTFIPGDNKTNGIFLPFYNSAGKSKNKLLTSEGRLVGIKDAVSIMEGMFTTIKEIQETLNKLPYSDAPYCIQTILLTGALAENGGRNCFLCSAAIYLKKKFKDNFIDALLEANSFLQEPLEESEVRGIYQSILDHGYDNYWCKKEPCCSYCDRRLCKSREYGVGRDRGNKFTGADCWGKLSKVMAGEPYYLWEVQIPGSEEFKTVRVDSVNELQNQQIMQKHCWRDLNWAPYIVNQNTWTDTVNQSMEGIKEREIPVTKETDTTEISALRDKFFQYLTHKQSQKDEPYIIKLNRVYYKDSVCYFTTQGLTDFLATGNRRFNGVNLMAELRKYGCTEGEVVYKNSKGVEVRIPCWQKPVDEELSQMNVFFDDIYDGDSDILQGNILRKEEGQSDSSETKF